MNEYLLTPSSEVVTFIFLREGKQPMRKIAAVNSVAPKQTKMARTWKIFKNKTKQEGGRANGRERKLSENQVFQYDKHFSLVLILLVVLGIYAHI